MNVLIVDDDADCRQIVALMLSKQGWTLHFATDGEEAVEMARSLQPDLILMDMLMPRMTGSDAVKVMRQDERLARTPICAITAMAFESDRALALASGYDAVITKPFGRRALLGTIAQLLPTSELPIPA